MTERGKKNTVFISQEGLQTSILLKQTAAKEVLAVTPKHKANNNNNPRRP